VQHAVLVLIVVGIDIGIGCGSSGGSGSGSGSGSGGGSEAGGCGDDCGRVYPTGGEECGQHGHCSEFPYQPCWALVLFWCGDWLGLEQRRGVLERTFDARYQRFGPESRHSIVVLFDKPKTFRL
jgi:hypothetical protein